MIPLAGCSASVGTEDVTNVEWVGPNGEDAAPDRESESAAPDAAYADVAETSDPENHAPTAFISVSTSTDGSLLYLDGHLSHDPDLGDAVDAWLWTISIDGHVTEQTGEHIDVYVPCRAKVLVATLVVKDTHGLASEPATVTRDVGSVLDRYVSVNDCTPGDECGTEDRPWCTISAGYVHRREIATMPIRVAPGIYKQGVKEIGGHLVDTPETLDWEAPDSTTEIEFGAVAVRENSPGASELPAATCEGWDTTSQGVVVTTRELAGWQVQHPRLVTLRGFCVIALPTAPQDKTVRALNMGSGLLAEHMIIRTDLVSNGTPLESAAVFADIPNQDAGLELYDSSIIAGSADDESDGVLAPPGNKAYVRVAGDVSFAPGSSARESYGVRVESVSGEVDGSVAGGPGSAKSVGVELRVRSGRASNLTAYGEGPGENFGLIAEGDSDLDLYHLNLAGRAASGVPLTVKSAVGLQISGYSYVDVAEVQEIDGAAAGVTATESAIGVRVDSPPLNHWGNQASVGIFGLNPTGGRIRGGASAGHSVGIEIVGPAQLSVGRLERVSGGHVSGPVDSAGSPSLASGIYLAGGNGSAHIWCDEVEGCDPDCVDEGVALSTPDPGHRPPLLGAGLTIAADASAWPPPKGKWDVDVPDGAKLSGGVVTFASPGIEPTAELAGIWALGDYDEGHTISLSPGASVIGTADAVDGSVPSVSEGVSLERARLTIDGQVEIVGGPARRTARGVWLRNAFPSGTTPPGCSAAMDAQGTVAEPFHIAGNLSQEPSSRPVTVYGIHDESPEAPDLANRVKLSGELPAGGASWSTVEGGWAAAGKSGDAVGASLVHTSLVSIDHVRIVGGVVAGGRRQRGLELEDVRTPAGSALTVVDGCLIEACGYGSATAHDPECELPVSEPSVGVSVFASPASLRWPLLFSNNLVFGGFNTRSGGGGSIALLASVDDLPGAGPPVRHFVHNFLSGQGAAPQSPCGSDPAGDPASEAARLVLVHPPLGPVVESNVAELVNNILHDGGLACWRFAVREAGIDADLQGLPMQGNDYALPLAGRDQLGPGYVVAVLREARSGGWADRCDSTEMANFPACLQSEVTAAADYAGSLALDPLFGAPGPWALVEQPGQAPIGAFMPTQSGLKAGAPCSLVAVDAAGVPRSASAPTVGPFEMP